MRMTTIAVLGALLAACGDGGDAAPDAGTTTPDAQPGPAVQVWRVLPPDVTPARAQAIAAALGLSGELVQHPDSIQILGDRLGPAGPIVLEGLAGELAVGNAVLRFAPGCGDGLDGDGDFYVDLEDPECASERDDDELLAGHQDRISATIFEGDIDAAGAANLYTIFVPPLLATTPGGGTITAQPVAVAPATGSFDPRNDAASLAMTFTLQLSCSGAGCFTGTCALALPTFTATTAGALYDQATGRGTLAATFAAAAVTSCAGGADPAQVNALLGLPDASASISLGFAAQPVFREIGPDLTLLRASGAILYGDPQAFATPTVAPGLVDDQVATSLATTFLESIDLLPPDAAIQVARQKGRDVTGAEIDLAVVVRFTPRLDTSPLGATPHLVHVHHADVVVRVGAAGAIVGLESSWRPAERHEAVPSRPENEARGALALQADLQTLTVDLGYAGWSRYEPQAFLDPLWVASDAAAAHAAATHATSFTPRIELVSPADPMQPVSAAAVTLAAGVEGGTPPFTIEWRSNVDGELGEGASLVTSLSPGRHEITLAVTDAAGSRISGATVLLATGPTALLARPARVPGGVLAGPPMPLTSGTRLTSSNGTSFTASFTPGRAGLDIAHNTVAGAVLTEALYFEQWRYVLDVVVNGTTYHIRSDKCIDGPLPSGGACTAPAPPFAVAGAAPPPNHVGAIGALQSSITISNLPGTFVLQFDYRSTNAYCGPPPPFGAQPFARKLGGTCPGYIPEVKWTYAPPAGGGIGCDALAQLCGANFGRTNSDGQPICDIPASQLETLCSTPGQTYQIAGFAASLYTNVVPHAAGTTLYGALASDNAMGAMGPPTTLAATSGAISYVNQPMWAPGDMFAEITPVPAETTASVATPAGRGIYDNVHSKVAPSIRYVTFPGCTDPRNLGDTSACLHLHESWFTGATSSQGQTVNWLLTRDRPAERRPMPRPSALVNGEALFTAPAAATDWVIWHESIATSSACGTPAGTLDNTMRPCRVFTSPIFLTE
jgi:hypothetical protein